MKFVRRVIAAILSVGLFVFLAYVFTTFMEPQGQNGWIAALVFVGVSAVGCILLYSWMAKSGRRIRLDPGLDDQDAGALGLGLTGIGIGGRRRRDDADPDDFGGRRRSDAERDGNADAETDGDLSGLS